MTTETAPQKTTWRPAGSCATSAPAAKPRFTAPPPSAIKLLLDAEAKLDAKDAHGDTPLSWASWHLRPDAILRLLLYGNFRIRPQRSSMREYLQGEPD
jgi:hypothetical protein